MLLLSMYGQTKYNEGIRFVLNDKIESDIFADYIVPRVRISNVSLI